MKIATALSIGAALLMIDVTTAAAAPAAAPAAGSANAGTADRAARARQWFRETCAEFGLHATFMAKRYGAESGSGGHVHQSLNRGGRNVFSDGAGGLSQEGAHYLGGLLATMADFSLLFNPATPEDWKTVVRGLIGRRLDVVEQKLADRDYLMGEFSVADGYLFTVLGWGRMVGVDVAARPLLAAYLARVMARPAVQQAMKEEGLIK